MNSPRFWGNHVWTFRIFKEYTIMVGLSMHKLCFPCIIYWSATKPLGEVHALRKSSGSK